MGSGQAILPGHHAGRLARIDLLRSLAMLWMTAYHFSFDLDHFGLINQDFHRDPFWTLQRTAIVSLFLFTAGLSQAIALEQGQTPGRFWRRWTQVAGAALLVSAGSWLMYPRSFISFGVLHGIALMLIIVRLSSGWGAWRWPLGALAMLAPQLAPPMMSQWPALEVFNSPWLNGIGLVNRLPITEDYVPLLPWLGVMWWGMAAGQWVWRHRPRWLGRPAVPLSGLRRGLVMLGRWSLAYYLLHQPVMIGLIWLVLQLR